MTANTWVTGGLWTMYEVNVGEHLLDFQCELPCQQDVGHFMAEAHLAWKVSDPEEVVRRHLVDVRGELEPLLCDRMRQITGTIDVRQRADAEKRINDEVGSDPRLPALGLEVCRFKVKLDLDRAARQHVDNITKTDRTREAEERQQKLFRSRMDFDRSVLELGRRESILLQLARDPKDIKAIVKMLQDEDNFVLDVNLEALKAMLNSGLFEEFDIDPTRLTLLEQLIEDVQARFRDRLLGAGGRKRLLEFELEQSDRTEESGDSKAEGDEGGSREGSAQGGHEESGSSKTEGDEGGSREGSAQGGHEESGDSKAEGGKES